MELSPVKPILLLLYAKEAEREQAETALEKLYGPIDFRASPQDFTHSKYYEKEMGTNLKRRLLSFQTLQPPDFLAQAKLDCGVLEAAQALEGQRRVNLDIGFLDLFKVVLASLKTRSNKIYLRDGVWADWVLYFHHQDWQTFIWTFPDFLDGRFNPDLRRIRQIFKAQRRSTNKDLPLKGQSNGLGRKGESSGLGDGLPHEKGGRP